MPFHFIGAYDGFDSVAEAKAYYKRCRTPKCFILEPKFIKDNDPVCAACGKKFTEHSKIANEEIPSIAFNMSESDLTANRCWYYPATKKVAVQRYDCAWKATLDSIFRFADCLL